MISIRVSEAGFHLDKGEGLVFVWFQQFWTREEKGWYMLDCIGLVFNNQSVGLVFNNQSVESQWRWNSVTISKRTQVP
jgi:hypothetical protein